MYSSVSGSYLLKHEHIGSALYSLKVAENTSEFLIKDFMIPIDELPVLDIRQCSFESIVTTMEKYKLGFTIVTNDQNEFSGIISNADIRKGLLKYRTFDDSKLKEMINRNPVVVNENQTVVDLLRIIKSKDFPVSYLPVLTDDHKISGAVTFINLVKGEA